MLDDPNVIKQRDPNDVLGSIPKQYEQISDWLRVESSNWASDVPTLRNYPKQIAMRAVGKTAVFYCSTLTAAVGKKMKDSWNEKAKNLAFLNIMSESSSGEMLAWLSHPVEKPFVIFDIISNLDDDRTLRSFEAADKLLSGSRPKANQINLAGDSIDEQMLWGSILADYAGVYLAILNNIDSGPGDLVEKFKAELGTN